MARRHWSGRPRKGGGLSALVLAVVAVSALADLAAAADKPRSRLAPALHDLQAEHTAHLAAGRARTAFRSAHPLVRLSGQDVVIDAIAEADGRALLADLTTMGLRHGAVAGRVVSGLFPVGALARLETLASLRFVQPSAAATGAGQVATQGDLALRTHLARPLYGLDGAGVTVGVLSDSFDCRGGAPADLATGDLIPVAVLQDEPGCVSGTDEGRAMLQIVHDVAPGSPLAFATAFGGQASFAANIQALHDAGARVILDDVTYFNVPVFQDGVVAQAVDSVVALGSAYFSAAGNSGRAAYSSVFRPGPTLADGALPSAPGAPHFFGGVPHDFDPGTEVALAQAVTVTAGASLVFALHWAEPSFSVSGPPGASTDFDIYLLDQAGSVVVAGSVGDNTGLESQELFAIVNSTGQALTGRILIVRHAGSATPLIKYFAFQRSGRATIDEFATDDGTIFGHANAQGAEAVGAAAYFQTPAFGVSPALLETFSGRGTTPVLFSVAGAPVTDSRDVKPGLVAPDGGNTTFFGVDVDADGLPNFFGTSAAAPHAAAVAALLRQAQPTLGPAEVYARLRATAVDMGSPGFDHDSGFGLVQADRALADETGAPVTTAQVLPEPNAAGWNRTAVTVQLDADDVGGPGVEAVAALLEGAEVGQLTAPGSQALVPVDAEGLTRIHFAARDVEGRREPIRSLDLRLDLTAPSILCQAAPAVLALPKRVLVLVKATVDVADSGSGPGGFTLASVTSSQADADTYQLDLPGDIQDWVPGQPDLAGLLRAESTPGRPPRVYTLTYQGQDMAGNTATCQATLTAPGLRGRQSSDRAPAGTLIQPGPASGRRR